MENEIIINENAAPFIREGVRVVLAGDWHGEWQTIFKKIDHFGLGNCLLVHVGDIGIGFSGGYERDIVKYNQKFKDRNIEFVGINGNHDNPAYFDGSINLSHFKLLPSYTVGLINGEAWQFVGGAISVDRKFRVHGRDYWREEKFVFDEKKAVKCDALICHTGPNWLGPACKGGFVQPFLDKDVHLFHELTEERDSVQKLMDICRPKFFACGHFHRHETNTYHGEGYTCEGRILDINEFFEYRK